MNKIKRIGLLTAGGDCPGLNAVIRAVTKAAVNDYNMEVIGIEDGYAGLIEGRFHQLRWNDVSGILHTGGTILGTSNRDNPFKYPVHKPNGDLEFIDVFDRVAGNIKKLHIEAVIAVGGDGTMAITSQMMERGVNVVGVPKTIDNDLAATDVTFGFDTALVTATEALDKLHTTAMSHHRVMIMETMGRYAGWIALYSGVAGGGDVILIPEIPFQLDSICHTVQERGSRGKRFSIIVAAEGAKPEGGQMVVQRIIKESTDQLRLGGIGQQLAGQIEDRTGIECRVTVLGHLQRGGSPSAFDRILGTRFGVKAVELAAAGQFGRMVALKGLNVESVPLQEAVGSLRLVSPDSEIIKAARSVGVSFGD
ncbi:MAG: 6-phosphofructokinase [Candidatus Edwardsbacteria bacterium RIFOXYD12_FULL_50_11]|uniref:ATP-dependent 6-phosphofructokinase n=1 Tax=Candidatus Edwardsbacteria bacterium GWF2_54_11 TaxID=1817851 RepID=A0A1F5RI34_9BACT|nr:MAG: 6-phosphofructokinase [Candidatus Edwardsbacteria bacterium RifOxyC12_full_54_24]OGF06102.1 MAG: 6-phosphofructokinase [Candidatus Edwardsbacteria bacterium RifOxyA12_full_54_48]OGF13833.1 MAG: 6-phosphofructokinase [Candidatus Edwardsbacteria bacterium GWF2_54_11]OGF17840.1 MAG: 6-phosphofructokinase [Candidatus Edwardsbacteria bacterium RIFOXYD12_FULL_50_11]OGJ18996.1 MAG: 6-phosphofructokinase [Candidatus Edwardsbacteria bacterium RifOxyB12_full_52_30]HBZ85977.1 6-phosphofructokinas